MKRALIVAAVVAAAIAVIATLRGSRSSASPTTATAPAVAASPAKPSLPPPPGARRQRVPSPEMPPDADAIGRAAYERAAAAQMPPGEAAFRAMIHAFIEYNRAFAEEQARKEGLTVAEVEELTYLGYLAMATQRLSDVEDLVERRFTADEQAALAELMHRHSSDTKEALRAAVARGASESERWAVIRAAEASYRQSLFAATGLDDDRLDALLAGDLAKAGAPLTTPIPDDIEPRPYVATQPRPTGARPPAR